MRKIINIYIRVVHRSVWVRFMPNPEPTCWNRVEKKVICHRPAGVIGLGNSEHQWVAGGSVEFETARKWWIKHRSGENLTGFYEISPNLVKISYDFMRFRQIRRKSHKIRWDLARSGQNLTGSKGNSAGNWKNIIEIWVFLSDFGKFWLKSGNLSVGFGFSGFKGGKPKPDPPESVFGDEVPPPTCQSSRVSRFRVGSG